MDESKKRILDRLNRIEGQVRGIRGMVEQERGCYDIVKQVAAVNGALRSLGLLVLEHHLSDCVSDTLEGRMQSEELKQRLMDLFGRLSS
ncbi:MAG: metal-sensitive transcriptional regulator [Candidatus Hydrogenedentes bacterium]|nr:metal-sensitive transcriptional regulator [Candidatus Hydrogenedentota bacterium]